jgi:prepilin-type N-terminal cleavage/methylation domain-containing protein
MSRSAGRATLREQGFTLLEILAVIAILALLATFVLPNLGAVRARSLMREAKGLAALLELARQRTIVTGIPHRMLIDLEANAYRIEWTGTDEFDDLETESVPVGTEAVLDLSPPGNTEQEYRPLPSRFGRLDRLDDDISFVGVETRGGWVRKGNSYIAFAQDGTADHATIVLDDETGQSISLDVLPLADVVRIHHEPR